MCWKRHDTAGTNIGEHNQTLSESCLTNCSTMANVCSNEKHQNTAVCPVCNAEQSSNKKLEWTNLSRNEPAKIAFIVIRCFLRWYMTYQRLLYTSLWWWADHMPSLSPLSDGTGLPETFDEPPSLNETTWTEMCEVAAFATDNEWQRRCFFKWSLLINLLQQISHSKRFSPTTVQHPL